MTLLIHVVQEADRFPKIDIFTAPLREMFHRIGDGVTVFTQALRLDPLVENGECAVGQHSHFGNQPPTAWIGVVSPGSVIQAASAPILSGRELSILNFASVAFSASDDFCNESTTKSCESFRPLFSPAATSAVSAKARPAR